MRVPEEIGRNTEVSCVRSAKLITKTSAELQNRHRLNEQHAACDREADVDGRGESARTQPPARLPAGSPEQRSGSILSSFTALDVFLILVALTSVALFLFYLNL